MGTTQKYGGASELGRNYDVEQVAEKRRQDEAELAAIERAERNAPPLGLLEELLEAMRSTNVEALRQRRVREVLVRRTSEITLEMIADRSDQLGAIVNAYARGLVWNANAEQWLPGEEPGVKTVRLRRVDPDRNGRYQAFTYPTRLRDDLALEDMNRLARAWSAAPADSRGPDPQDVHVRVVPNVATGEFEMPLAEAVKVWRCYKDDLRRVRNRRNGGPGDGKPIVAECNAAAQWTPVKPLDGAA